MPKTHPETLIELANKKSLTDTELAQFKKSFTNLANSHATQQLKKNSATKTNVHEVIESVTRKSGAMFGPKPIYNLLETALKSKNDRISTYLIEEFEKSYTLPGDRPKDLQQIYNSISTVPPHLPIDIQKFPDRVHDRELKTYVINVDAAFEYKYARDRVAEKNRKTTREASPIEPASPTESQTDRSSISSDRSSSTSKESRTIIADTHNHNASISNKFTAEEAKAAAKIQALVRGTNVRKNMLALAKQGLLGRVENLTALLNKKSPKRNSNERG